MFEELKEILSAEFNVDPAIIKPESGFIEDLKLNSLEIADFVVMCEEKFGMEVDDEDIHSIITVGDLSEYISSRRKN